MYRYTFNTAKLVNIKKKLFCCYLLAVPGKGRFTILTLVPTLQCVEIMTSKNITLLAKFFFATGHKDATQKMQG